MNKETLNFEEIIEELEKITSQLEAGSMPLDQAVSNYMHGIELKNIAEKQLKDAYIKLQSVQEKKYVSEFREKFSKIIGNMQEYIIKSIDEKVDKKDIKKYLTEFTNEILDLYANYLSND